MRLYLILVMIIGCALAGCSSDQQREPNTGQLADADSDANATADAADTDDGDTSLDTGDLSHGPGDTDADADGDAQRDTDGAHAWRVVVLAGGGAEGDIGDATAWSASLYGRLLDHGVSGFLIGYGGAIAHSTTTPGQVEFVDNPSVDVAPSSLHFGGLSDYDSTSKLLDCAA